MMIANWIRNVLTAYARLDNAAKLNFPQTQSGPLRQEVGLTAMEAKIAKYSQESQKNGHSFTGYRHLHVSSAGSQARSHHPWDETQAAERYIRQGFPARSYSKNFLSPFC